MKDPSLGDDLELALELGSLAAEIGLESLEKGMETAIKADGTPVSSADFAVERCLVGQLSARRPDDGILSEEGGGRSNGERRWILDPIDGTANLIAGSPHWGTHIALEEDGQIVLGVITQPMADQQWWAARGAGAFRSRMGQPQANRVLLRVSTISDLEQARVSVWCGTGDTLEKALRSSAQWVEPDFDLFDRLFAGELEAIVARGGGVWDHAPGVVIVEEAGGHFCDLEGGSRLDSGGAIYTNGRIDGALLQVMGVPS